MNCSLRRNSFRALRLSFFCTLLIAAFTACTEEESVPGPEGVMSDEQFTELLVDMTLAESAIALNISKAMPNDADSVYAFNPLTEHGLSDEDYRSTIRYFAAHPDKYKKIYTEVLKRLSAMEAVTKGVRSDSVPIRQTVLPRSL